MSTEIISCHIKFFPSQEMNVPYNMGSNIIEKADLPYLLVFLTATLDAEKAGCVLLVHDPITPLMVGCRISNES